MRRKVRCHRGLWKNLGAKPRASDWPGDERLFTHGGTESTICAKEWICGGRLLALATRLINNRTKNFHFSQRTREMGHPALHGELAEVAAPRRLKPRSNLLGTLRHPSAQGRLKAGSRALPDLCLARAWRPKYQRLSVRGIPLLAKNARNGAPGVPLSTATRRSSRWLRRGSGLPIPCGGLGIDSAGHRQSSARCSGRSGSGAGRRCCRLCRIRRRPSHKAARCRGG